jgi:hypothetical protein
MVLRPNGAAECCLPPLGPLEYAHVSMFCPPNLCLSTSIVSSLVLNELRCNWWWWYLTERVNTYCTVLNAFHPAVPYHAVVNRNAKFIGDSRLLSERDHSSTKTNLEKLGGLVLFSDIITERFCGRTPGSPSCCQASCSSRSDSLVHVFNCRQLRERDSYQRIWKTHS